MMSNAIATGAAHATTSLRHAGGLGGFDGRVEGVGGNIHALTLTAAGVRAEGENYPATGDGRAQPSTNCRAGWIE